MSHPLSSQSDELAVSRSRNRSRVLLCVVLMLAGSLASAADPPAKAKTDGKEAAAHFRAYLPVIRLKAKLDSERQEVANLEEWLRKYEIWLEGGAVNLIERSQIEEGYHRSRVRVLRLDADYRDSLDQFTSRFRISAERRRQMEDAATSPLTKVFQRYAKFTRDFEASLFQLIETESEKDVAKVRPSLVKVLTESALVKDTTLPKRFLKHWDEWRKMDDRDKILKQITEKRSEIDQLRERQAELALKEQDLPETDRQRLEALKFERDVGEFQFALLIYEKQPWKVMKDDEERIKRRREIINGFDRTVQTLLDYAYVERLNRLYQSWPGIDPVKVKDMDLLTSTADKAAAMITSLLKSPDAQLAGKKKVRHLRTLAESYPIQKRLFHIAFLQRQLQKNPPKRSSDPGSDLILPGLVGPVGPRPTIDKRPFAPGPILKREAAFKQAKRQLLQTWIDYQMLRLDLYSDLGLSVPDR